MNKKFFFIITLLFIQDSFAAYTSTNDQIPSAPYLPVPVYDGKESNEFEDAVPYKSPGAPEELTKSTEQQLDNKQPSVQENIQRQELENRALRSELAELQQEYEASQRNWCGRVTSGCAIGAMVAVALYAYFRGDIF